MFGMSDFHSFQQGARSFTGEDDDDERFEIGVRDNIKLYATDSCAE